MEAIAIRFSCGEFSLFFQKIIGEKIGKHVFEQSKMFFPQSKSWCMLILSIVKFLHDLSLC
jgi:hypothetical protein